MSADTDDHCIWYTDKLKEINEHIWFPNNVIQNNQFNHKFNSKLINFKSFKPELNDQLENLEFKKITVNNYNSEKFNITDKYYGKIIKMYQDHIKKYKENKEDFDKRKQLCKQIYAKSKKAQKKFTKDIDMIGQSIHSYKVKLDINKEQKNIILKWMNEAKYVYNFCVDCFNNDKANFPSNFQQGKQYIFDKLYKDQPKNTPYDILSYEIINFYSNLSSCYSNLQNQNIQFFEMKYKNTKKHQTITIYKKCVSKNGIYSSFLGKIGNFDEIINSYMIECDCKLTYDKITGNFYFYIPQYIQCKYNYKGRSRIAAIDPGEVEPFTYYSLDSYGSIGGNSRYLILNIEAKIRKYQRLLNNRINKKGKRIKKKKLIVKINKLYRRIKGIVNELHKKAALFFCQNYDIILIPKFETQQMVCDNPKQKATLTENINKIKNENKEDKVELKKNLKQYKRQTRLNGRVKFVLNQLSHYKFRQHLFSKAKEYGCLCIEVTEEFTSQLCTQCGKLSKSYNKRMKKCKHCNSEINRDVNGARNILIKYILELLSHQCKD